MSIHTIVSTTEVDRRIEKPPSERARLGNFTVRIFWLLLLISSTSIVFTFQKWIHLGGAIRTSFTAHAFPPLPGTTSAIRPPPAGAQLTKAQRWGFACGRRAASTQSEILKEPLFSVYSELIMPLGSKGRCRPLSGFLLFRNGEDSNSCADEL